MSNEPAVISMRFTSSSDAPISCSSRARLALAASGRHGDAASLWRNLVGRDVLEGRWTFQIVEGFDDDYYDAARTEVIRLEADLVEGRRHAHEEQLRERRQAQRSAYLSAETEDT